MTNDPELADALSKAAPFFTGAPTARVVHDLAVKGAEALAREHAEEDEAIENLIVLSTMRSDALDWDLLERIDEVAWGQ